MTDPRAAADNRTVLQDSKGGLLTNTYNAVNLLTNRQFTGNSATLRFDYAYNRTTNDGTWTYTYDDAGQRTKKSKGASLETWEFGYDVNGRLIAVSKRATDGGTLQLRVDYKYDALGRRIERYEDSNGDGNTDVTERFGYDGEHVWADLDGSNNLTYRRLFGERVDTPRVRCQRDNF